jgi:phenylacetate-CoA ligase
MSMLDVARGAYVRSPPALRRSLAPLLSLVPTRARFGPTYRRQRAEIARAAADPAFAEARQLENLRRLITRAHAHSPFYRRLIDTAFGPHADLSAVTPADLRRLPVLDRHQLTAIGEAVLAAPAASLDRAETSGSNAEKPFAFWLDKNRSAREMAFVYDVWSRIGFDERTARAAFRGLALYPKGERVDEWDPALRELRLSVFPMTLADAARYLDLIDRRCIRYLYGYASALDLFCRQLRRLDRRPKLQIKGIMPISEPLLPHQRRAIAGVLGDVPFACFYGLSEKVLFAAELPGSGGAYAFDPLYGLAELVDAEGRPVTEKGKEGRIIGTGFLSTGMPFIRYDTGDSARLVAPPGPENGCRLIVDRLMPRRKPDYLVTAGGDRVVTVDLTPEDPEMFAGIDEFQFYQDTPGKVLLRYVGAPEGDAADAQSFAGYLGRRTQGKLSFEPVRVDRIVAGRGGKRAFVEQRLNLAD